MTRDEIQSELDVLRENLDRMAQIPQASYEGFASDFRNVDSALHRLQTSIQALMDLGILKVARLGLAVPRTSREVLEVLERAGRLPPGATQRFGPVFAFRNRVVHLYDRVDARVVYRVLHEERDDLEELLRLLLAIQDPDAP